MTTEISPQDLKRGSTPKPPVTLLDVRDDWETRLARLDHAAHIPVEEIEHRLDELIRTTRSSSTATTASAARRWRTSCAAPASQGGEPGRRARPLGAATVDPLHEAY